MKKENMKIGRSIDFERETRVLLENMQSSIKFVAEGHSGIISGLEGVKSRLDKVDTRLDRVEGRLGSVEGRLGSVESELHTVKMVVFDLDSRLTKVESKLDVSIGQNDERFRQIEKKLTLA